MNIKGDFTADFRQKNKKKVCGFDTDARDPLQMLSQIEARLEEVFVVLDTEEGKMSSRILALK